jgi:hypothetical protein
MKHLTILLTLFTITFSSESILAQEKVNITQQEIVELKNEFIILQKKNEEIEKAMIEYKSQLNEVRLEKNFYDIIVSSQWNIFSTILFLILTVVLAINLKTFLRDIPQTKKKVEELEKLIKESKHIAVDALWNSNRAQYDTHKYNKSYEFAALFASRCMIYFTNENDVNGELHWLNNIKESIRNVTGKLKKKRIESEVLRNLKEVKNHSEPHFGENISLADEIIKSINDKVDLEEVA